ncbi:hypothetical protein ES703_09387 [subsurface metagenome]
MVTELKTRERIEIRRLNLGELGEMVGVPIKVRPWWGSVRRRFGTTSMVVRIREGIVVDEASMPLKAHVVWECPADGQNRKKAPEVQGGVIIVWEGQCGYKGAYDKHTHAQTIEVKSVAHQAMLISLRLSETARSYFLLGVDGGSPFVVQVTKRPQTVDEAFQWLMPKKVKEAVIQGLDVKRQGDWFFIPTSREPRLFDNGVEVPARTGLKANKLYKGARLIYNCAETRHWGARVVYASVLGLPCLAPFVKGNVKAPDHEPLHLDGWHIGIRNRSHPWRNTQPGVGD